MSDTISALDLVTDAYAELNLFSPGEAIPNTDAQFGLRALNGLMGSLAQQHLTIPAQARLVFNLVVDQGSPATPYTIGPGGTFNTTQPPNVDALKGAALVIPASQYETPLSIMAWTDWQGFPNKTYSAPQPTQLVYAPTFTAGLGTIYLWPQASDTTNQLVLYVDQPLGSFATLTTSYQVPPGYRDMLLYQLALRLAIPYNREISADLKEKAASALSLIKRGNVQQTNMENWLGGQAQYDIISGVTWYR